MSGFDLFILMTAVYLAPNLTPSARFKNAVICLLFAAAFGALEIAKKLLS